MIHVARRNKQVERSGEIHLVVRADASARTGVGHVVRCLALAQAWVASGGQATLLSSSNVVELRRRAESVGVEFAEVQHPHPDPADLERTLRTVRQLEKAWVVLDGYQFDSRYQKSLRDAGFSLLVIDDTSHLPHYHANVLLNQNINAEWQCYSSDSDTVFLLGTGYSLLRHEFLDWRDRSLPARNDGCRVLVTIGGSDPENLTAKVVKGLNLARTDGIEAKVVLGPANPHVASVEKLVGQSERTVHVLRDVSDMPWLMAWADLAISGAGTTCWELMFMGVPSILIEAADNQRENAAGLDAIGAAVSLGQADEATPEQIADCIDDLCQDHARRSAMSDRGRSLVDGRGAERVVSLIEALTDEPSTRELELRRADRRDALQLWRLANEPTVRINSFTPEPISLEAHMEWYDRKLGSPETRVWVLDLAGLIVAQARYERVASDAAEIDYSVAPAFRGKGMGTQILQRTWRQASEELNVECVRGVVLESNQPSVKAFLKSGFGKTSEEVISGRRCHIYEIASS